MWFFILGIFFLPLVLFGKELDLTVKSPTVLLINAQTGAILFQKNADLVRYPSSTTKIATALYVLEKLGPRLEYEFASPSADALRVVRKHAPKKEYHLETDAVLMGLRPQEEVSMMDLLHATLIYSANDGANALAEAISGSIPQFVVELNEYLRGIGCKSTHFVNPSGWHHARHVTTAFDLAIMARRLLADPLLAKIVSSTEYELHQTNRNPARKVRQKNKLLVPGSKLYYPFATGLKTGYHVPSGFNVVASASNGERDLIAVILGASSSSERFEDAQKIFNAAFAEKKVQRTLFAAEGEVFQFQDEKRKIFFRAKLGTDIAHSYYPSEQVGYDAKISWSFKTPIKTGQVVGTLRVDDHRGETLCTSPLLAIDEVPLSFNDFLQKPWMKQGALIGISFPILGMIFVKWRRKSA